MRIGIAKTVRHLCPIPIDRMFLHTRIVFPEEFLQTNSHVGLNVICMQALRFCAKTYLSMKWDAFQNCLVSRAPSAHTALDDLPPLGRALHSMGKSHMLLQGWSRLTALFCCTHTHVSEILAAFCICTSIYRFLLVRVKLSARPAINRRNAKSSSNAEFSGNQWLIRFCSVSVPKEKMPTMVEHKDSKQVLKHIIRVSFTSIAQ